MPPWMVDKDWMVYAMGLLHDQNTIAVCFGYQKNLSFFYHVNPFFLHGYWETMPKLPRSRHVTGVGHVLSVCYGFLMAQLSFDDLPNRKKWWSEKVRKLWQITKGYRSIFAPWYCTISPWNPIKNHHFSMVHHSVQNIQVITHGFNLTAFPNGSEVMGGPQSSPCLFQY